MDSTQDENQAPSEVPEQDAQPQDTQAEPTPVAPEPQEKPHRPRAEEALAAMRADLREEETQEQANAKGIKRLFQRLFRRRRAPSSEEAETPSRLDELQFPEPPAARMAPPKEPVAPEAAEQESQPAAPAAEQPKPDFQSMVRTRLGGAFAESIQREPLEMEPPAPVEEEEGSGAAPTHSILTTLRQEEEEPVMPEPVDFRQAALEDYVVATDEPEEADDQALTRRFGRSWRYMPRTAKRLLIGTLVMLGLVLLGGTAYAAIAAIGTPTVAPTPTLSIVPIPISVSLPGGWVFPLRPGSPINGVWNPTEAEWLSGTEVCRWVSLPWTVQLEAVLRTLKANDEVQLSMSNYDGILYKVQSIEQVPSSNINKLCPEGPSLLLILSKQGTDERWVVTAVATAGKP